MSSSTYVYLTLLYSILLFFHRDERSKNVTLRCQRVKSLQGESHRDLEASVETTSFIEHPHHQPQLSGVSSGVNQEDHGVLKKLKKSAIFQFLNQCWGFGMFINSLVDEPAGFGVQSWIFLDLGPGSAQLVSMGPTNRLEQH